MSLNCQRESAAVTAINDQTNMFKRFQGCLLGALAGDCLGAPWEGCSALRLKNRVVEFINEKCVESQSPGKMTEIFSMHPKNVTSRMSFSPITLEILR